MSDLQKKIPERLLSQEQTGCRTGNDQGLFPILGIPFGVVAGSIVVPFLAVLTICCSFCVSFFHLFAFFLHFFRNFFQIFPAAGTVCFRRTDTNIFLNAVAIIAPVKVCNVINNQNCMGRSGLFLMIFLDILSAAAAAARECDRQSQKQY